MPGETLSIEGGIGRPVLLTWPGLAPRPPLAELDAMMKTKKKVTCSEFLKRHE